MTISLEPRQYAIIISGISCTQDQFLSNMVRIGFLPEQVMTMLTRMPLRLLGGLNQPRAVRYRDALAGAGAIATMVESRSRCG